MSHTTVGAVLSFLFLAGLALAGLARCGVRGRLAQGMETSMTGAVVNGALSSKLNGFSGLSGSKERGKSTLGSGHVASKG